MKKKLMSIVIAMIAVMLLLQFLSPDPNELFEFAQHNDEQEALELSFDTNIKATAEEIEANKEANAVGIYPNELRNFSTNPNFIKLPGYDFSLPVLYPFQYTSAYSGPNKKGYATSRKMHKGIDIATGLWHITDADKGKTKGQPWTSVSPILASYPGTVVLSRAVRGGGNTVMVEHDYKGQKITTTYMHMMNGTVTVKVGDKVNQGDEIGREGNTGNIISSRTTADAGAHSHLQFHSISTVDVTKSTVEPTLYVGTLGSEGNTNHKFSGEDPSIAKDGDSDLSKYIKENKSTIKTSPDLNIFTTSDKLTSSGNNNTSESSGTSTGEQTNLSSSMKPIVISDVDTPSTLSSYGATKEGAFKYLEDVILGSGSPKLTLNNFNVEKKDLVYLPIGSVNKPGILLNRGTLLNTSDDYAKVIATSVNEVGDEFKHNGGTVLVFVQNGKVGSLNANNLTSSRGDLKVDNGKVQYLRKEVQQPLIDLNRAYSNAFGEGIHIVSMMRTFANQKARVAVSGDLSNSEKYNNFIIPQVFSYATAGGSEHNTGWALDIKSAVSGAMNKKKDDGSGNLIYAVPEMEWLRNNAWRYGFTQTYKPGREQTSGVIEEAWHYRYVGKELAFYLTKFDWTLEDLYFEAKKSKNPGLQRFNFATYDSSTNQLKSNFNYR